MFLSATMGKHLFNKILVDRNIPDTLRDKSLYVNTITEMPKPPVESDVIFLKREEIIPAATNLIMNFLDCSYETRAVLFFTDKKS